MAEVMRAAATNVRASVIPQSGHWVMEENPLATITLVRSFLEESDQGDIHNKAL
jgi:pimeloyl-ACP methyl ester carboxylesterase